MTMGLDMYFEKRTYVRNWKHTPKEDRHSVTVRRNGKVLKSIKRNRVSYIIESVGYWRKFNALHAWFVNNLADGNDDCKEIYVPKNAITELVVTLEKVATSLQKSKKKRVLKVVGYSSKQGDIKKRVTVYSDTSLAEELLPTQSGFFFGGTEYDWWYLSEIKRTIKLFRELLAEDNENSEFYYVASW